MQKNPPMQKLLLQRMKLRKFWQMLAKKLLKSSKVLRMELSSTVKTLDSARDKAGKEAEGVQAEGAKAVEEIQSSAGDRRDAAVKLIIDSLMSN